MKEEEVDLVEVIEAEVDLDEMGCDRMCSGGV